MNERGGGRDRDGTESQRGPHLISLGKLALPL